MTNEEAIKIIEEMYIHWLRLQREHICEKEEGEKVINALLLSSKALKNEPKKGEWIKKVDNVGFVSYICSECGFELELEDCSDSYYCVNCGAKMNEKHIADKEV